MKKTIIIIIALLAWEAPLFAKQDIGFAAYTQSDQNVFVMYGEKIKDAIDKNTHIEIHVNFVVVDKYKELTKYPLIAKITAVIFREKDKKTLMGNDTFRIDVDRSAGTKYEFNVLLLDPTIESKMSQGCNKNLSSYSIIIPKANVTDVESARHVDALKQFLLSIPDSELATYLYAGSKVKEKDGHLELSPAPTAVKLKQITMEYMKQTK